MKSIVALVSISFVALMVVACSPEPMTRTQACKAWVDLELNAPAGGDLVEYAAYSTKHYREMSNRIDGELGRSFKTMYEVNEATLDDGETMPDAAFAQWKEAYESLTTICGSPYK